MAASNWASWVRESSSARANCCPLGAAVPLRRRSEASWANERPRRFSPTALAAAVNFIGRRGIGDRCQARRDALELFVDGGTPSRVL